MKILSRVPMCFLAVGCILLSLPVAFMFGPEPLICSILTLRNAWRGDSFWAGTGEVFDGNKSVAK
ncbi:hypothetical protein ACYPKM_00555 [Pseudomonas aeruginosa]